jgi:hypothetical protein
MRERPILFSALMVRAILAGRKTQTRRLVTVPWRGSQRALPYEPYYVDSDGELLFCDEYGDYHPIERAHPPYAEVGDRLWVKETHARGTMTGGAPWVRYRADVESAHMIASDGSLIAWRPSIHMPRWASRITLEVTGVRVERLQTIGASDAQAEGVDARLDLATQSFSWLWDSINGKRAAWASNPWVWVVEFRRVEAADRRSWQTSANESAESGKGA